MVQIAIPTPTSSDLAYNRRCWPAYAEAVRAQGAHPVEIPLDLASADLASLAGSCQAILLPGSPADVSPDRYGQAIEEHTSPADLARENTDLFLLEHAYGLHKPIFGVCFGCQILNIYQGGTLLQDLTTLPVNHPSAPGVLVAHTAAVLQSSLLDSIVAPIESEASRLDGTLRLPVNSSHHQAVGIVGQNLVVSARCPQDSVIEAIEGPQPDRHFVLGAQWHPERTIDTSAASRALFARFVAESAQWGSA